MSVERDQVDDHLDRWCRVMPDLDPEIEGPVTRMLLLVRHLRRVKRSTLAAHELQTSEYETLHALVGRGEPHEASPTELAAELQLSPAAMTGRIDGLERRGLLHRLPSPDDRRRVVLRLSPAGHQAWRSAMDAMGDEELRIFGALDRTERRQLDDLLRRLVRAAG